MRLASVVVLVVGVGALVTRFTVAPLDRYDEGVPVLKGMLVSAGAIPYRDFSAGYGPLDSYLLGALFHLFGLEVLVERLAAAAVAILFISVSWWLCGIVGLRPPMRTLITGLLSLVSVSIPMLTPTVLANLIGLCAFACFFLFLERPRWRLALATGVLTGVASFTRPEFAAVLGIGLLVGYGVLAVRRLDGAGHALAGYLLGVAATGALLWTPVVLAAGVHAVFLDVALALSTNAEGRWIPLGQGPDGPAIIAISLCFGSIWLWGVGQAMSHRRHPVHLARLAALIVSAILAFDWVLGRADAPHAIGAWPLTAVLLALLMSGRRTGRPRPRDEAVISLIAVCFFSGLVVVLAGRDLVRPADASVAIPHAAVVGNRSWIPAPELAAVIQAIDDGAPPGRPIFVGLQRNDQVVFNDVMLYMLAGRRPGTVYAVFIPALTTRDDIQHLITCQLARSGTALAVLGPNTPGEPWNASTRAGSQLLDRWLRAHTASRVDVAPYVLLRLRLDPANSACDA